MPRLYMSRASQLRSSVVAALLASLLAASAWITLPVAPVPVTLQVFVVLLTAILLSPAWAAASVGLYVLLGAVGLPVFAGPSGGFGVLAGPTGGYIWGFLLGAAAGSAVRQALPARVPDALADAVTAAVTIATVYLLGWAQLAAVTRMGVAPAFLAGVVPFLPVDVAKAAAAVAVAGALRAARVAQVTAR